MPPEPHHGHTRHMSGGLEPHKPINEEEENRTSREMAGNPFLDPPKGEDHGFHYDIEAGRRAGRGRGNDVKSTNAYSDPLMGLGRERGDNVDLEIGRINRINKMEGMERRRKQPEVDRYNNRRRCCGMSRKVCFALILLKVVVGIVVLVVVIKFRLEYV